MIRRFIAETRVLDHLELHLRLSPADRDQAGRHLAIADHLEARPRAEAFLRSLPR